MLKRVLFASIAVILLLMMAFLAWLFLSVPQGTRYAVPNPNGYDTLLKAGKQVTAIPEDYATTGDAEVLKEFLHLNSEAESAIIDAADQEFLVVTDSLPLQAILDDIGPLRAAQRLLIAKARLAEIEGDLDTQIEVYAQLWRIGNRCARGGLLVHHQAASAYESMAIEPLTALVTAKRLSAEQASGLLKELKRTPRFVLQVEDIVAAEEVMLRKENGVINTVMMEMTIGNSFLEDALTKLQVKEDQVAVAFEELLGRLAQY